VCDSLGFETPAPDRYADAVRARRAELRGARALLLGGHRAELRGGLAAGRLAASAELSTTLAGLGRELRHHADTADGTGRAALPALTAAAVGRLAARTADGWAAALLPGVRRVAAACCVSCGTASGTDPVAAVLARPPPPVALPAPGPPPAAVRALLAGAAGGTWRLALFPVAVLPAVGLPALGGRAVLPLAVGVGLALLVAAARAHRVATDRARLRSWAAEVVGAVRTALETELAYRLLELERVAGAELDETVERRRAEVDAELRALAPQPEGSVRVDR
jgi:hypothetical protein